MIIVQWHNKNRDVEIFDEFKIKSLAKVGV